MQNKWLWLVLAGWSLFFGIIFWWLDREAGWIVFLVMVGLTLFLASVAYGVPRLRYWQQRRGPGEAWIAPTAVYFDGVLVHWNSWGTRLEQVVWRDQEDAVPARFVNPHPKSSTDFHLKCPTKAESEVANSPRILNVTVVENRNSLL